MHRRRKVDDGPRRRRDGKPVDRSSMIGQHVVELVHHDPRQPVVLPMRVHQDDPIADHVRDSVHLSGSLVGDDRVWSDGELLQCDPAKVLPMAQRYFLF